MAIIKENEFYPINNCKDLQMMQSIKDTVKEAIYGKE